MRSFIILLLFTSNQCWKRNNVCKRFIDYNFKDISPNCWHNPDAEDRTNNIVTRHGYPLEQYEVVTEDSFILTVFRIPPRNQTIKGIVFLQHPALSSSSIWVARGKDSFAFLLSDAGYDVWIGNFRATSYSEKHKYLSQHKHAAQYWNYSFHEFGTYDLPAQIKFVRERTDNKQKLIYIGHSVATTAALIYSSLKPDEVEERIKLLILWSPVAFMGNIETPARILAPLTTVIHSQLDNLEARGITFNGVLHNLFKIYCLSIPSFLNRCSTIIDDVVGPQNQGGNPLELPVLIYQNLDGFSTKTVAHFGQLVNAKDRFQMYDYGPRLNRAYYGNRSPTPYPLEKMRVPVRVVFGENDYFSSEKDARLLYDGLQEKLKMGIEKIEDFNHFDFHYGKQVKEVLHVPTVKYLDDYVYKN